MSVIEQHPFDPSCRLPGVHCQLRSDLGDRHLVAMGLERGNGTVNKRFCADNGTRLGRQM